MKILKFIILSIIILLVPIAIFVITLSRFTQATGQPPLYFLSLARHSLLSNQVDQPFNLLLLGLDRRHDWLENTETTDTIIVANFQPSGPKVNTVSLPRDLWDYSRKAKINGTYQDLKATSQLASLPEVFSRLTGQIIPYYLIIDTQDLIDFVKLIGGVDVYLDHGFTDTQYPNPAYINQVGSTAPTYVTIEFPPGSNHLDENNVTEFVRSRKSSDDPATGGTDLGRIKRQQLLLQAITSGLSTTSFLLQPNNLAKLYLFWQQNLETNIPDQLIGDLLFKIFPKINKIKVSTLDTPVSPTNPKGVVYHPSYFANNQWVFLPLSPDYSDLQGFIRNSFVP